jgi:hypothetical protein
MRSWFIVVFLINLTLPVFAQEQLTLRLNEKGILKILKMAVQYNSSVKGSQKIIIPQNIYRFTLPKEKLLSNPLVPLVNEISDLNLNNDLEFYLNTTDINISGEIEEKSLEAKIFNSTESGFDVRISLKIPSFSAEGAKLTLCEDKARNTKRCGEGLKSSLNQLKINTFGAPVAVSMVLRFRTDGKVARVSMRSVESNLEGRGAPNLNINFKSIDVPKISVVINDLETVLDTSRLREEILKRKHFLGQKLLAFIGDFVANDVAEMLNVYLVNKEIATSYQIYRKENLGKFDEFLASRNYPLKEYQRPDIQASVQKSNPMTAMMNQISELVQKAQLGISLSKISTPGNKDIELSGLVNFMLNGQAMKFKNTLGNSQKELPRLNLGGQREFDINLAISEPLINGVLDVANSTKLFQEVFESLTSVKGFSIRNVKLHFSGEKILVCVVNAQVDLKLLESSGVKGWAVNRLAAWLERNNNNSVIFFPIEVSVIPVFKNLPGGGSGLDLRVLSPFNSTNLSNRFNYPSNVPNMTEIVRDGIMEELRASLEPHTNKTYSIDLSKFLNQSGVEFMPKSISINQGAYLMLGLDIMDIKFNSKNPNLR